MLKKYTTKYRIHSEFYSLGEEFPIAHTMKLRYTCSSSRLLDFYKEVGMDISHSVNFSLFDYIREDNTLLITDIDTYRYRCAAYGISDEDAFEYIRMCIRLNVVLAQYDITEFSDSTKDRLNDVLKESQKEFHDFNDSLPEYLSIEEDELLYEKKIAEINKRILHTMYDTDDNSKLFELAKIDKTEFLRLTYLCEFQFTDWE